MSQPASSSSLLCMIIVIAIFFTIVYVHYSIFSLYYDYSITTTTMMKSGVDVTCLVQEPGVCTTLRLALWACAASSAFLCCSATSFSRSSRLLCFTMLCTHSQSLLCTYSVAFPLSKSCHDTEYRPCSMLCARKCKCWKSQAQDTCLTSQT